MPDESRFPAVRNALSVLTDMSLRNVIGACGFDTAAYEALSEEEKGSFWALPMRRLALMRFFRINAESCEATARIIASAATELLDSVLGEFADGAELEAVISRIDKGLAGTGTSTPRDQTIHFPPRTRGGMAS